MEALKAPTVLANRGIPVLVYETVGVKDEESGLVDWEANFDAPRAQKYVTINNLTASYLEEKYGSLDEFQEALVTKTNTVVQDTLAFIWKQPAHQTAVSLLDAAINEYRIAILVAYLRAQGVSVDDSGKLLRQQMDLLVKGVETMGVQALGSLDKVEKIMAKKAEETSPEEPLFESPGTTGSESGSSSDDLLMSSGPVR